MRKRITEVSGITEVSRIMEKSAIMEVSRKCINCDYLLLLFQILSDFLEVCLQM